MTGKFPPGPIIVALAVVLAVTAHSGLGRAMSSNYLTSPAAERQHIARVLLNSRKVDLLTYHISGVRDSASANDNLTQVAKGDLAKLSYYGNAPGGKVELDLQMLRALYTLVAEGHSFRITELAGASHSRTSRHYAGLAFDIDFLDGKKVGSGHPTYRTFMKRCRELGATEVLGPGSRGHSTHIHVAWPRE